MNYSMEATLLGEPIILENIQEFFLSLPGVVQRMERDNVNFTPRSKTMLDFIGIKFTFACAMHLVKAMDNKQLKKQAADALTLGLQYADESTYLILQKKKQKEGQEKVEEPVDPMLLDLQERYAKIKSNVDQRVWNLTIEDRVLNSTLRAVLHFIDCVTALDYAHAGADALHCIMHVGKAYAYMGAEKSGFVVDQKAYEKACYKMAQTLAKEMRGKHARI